MVNILLLVVVIATTIFLFMKIQNTEKELHETQQLLLQFMDLFEERYRELSENRNQKGILRSESEIHEQSPRIESHDLTTSENTLFTDDPLSLERRYSEIVEGMKEGKSVEEIAKEIGKGTGEVRLIMELMASKKR